MVHNVTQHVAMYLDDLIIIIIVHFEVVICLTHVQQASYYVRS